MQYRKIGKLDWKASALGFGCMRLPVIDDDVAHIDQPMTTKMIRHAIDEGLNYVDTAYMYHDGKSETAVGIALKDGYREKVMLASKSPVWLIKEPDDYDRLLDEQRERLQVETIDFYLMHSLDSKNWKIVREMNLIERAEEARADGRIRYIGFSFHDNLELFKEIVDAYDGWDFCQIQYNYMDTEFQAGRAGLHYAAERGLGVIVMEPLRGGRLTKDLPALRPIWSGVADERTPADWALQWLWSQPEVSLALSGMSTMDQVRENLASADASQVGLLSMEELKVIDRVRATMESLSPIDCTQCGYCMPCPHGVNIPLNFEVYNRVAMYDYLGGGKWDYANRIPEREKAANCIQCEECLPKCPQNIEISTWMPVVDDVLANDAPYQTSV